MITGYNHAMITVPPACDDKVRKFYGVLLGLAEIPVPPALQGRGLIWFAVGNRELHVGIEDGVNRNTRAHLAYEVNDMAAMRSRLKNAGIEMIEQPKIERYDRVHIHDPFGNRVELIGVDTN